MSNEKILVPAGKALVFLGKDSYFFCDAVGKHDHFFHGNILLCPGKSIADDFTYHSNIINYLLNGFDFISNNDQFFKNHSVMMIGQKDFNPENITPVLLADNLFLFNFSNDYVLKNLNNGLNKAVVYFSTKETHFELSQLSSQLQSNSFPYENKIENKNCTQFTMIFKHESLFSSFFKKNVIIIDLGDINKSFLQFLTKHYNVYVMNPYSDIKEIKDLKPSMIFLSDGHGDLPLCFEQLHDLIHSIASIDVKIYGFGIGFLLLVKYLEKFRIEKCNNFEKFFNIFDKKIMLDAMRVLQYNIKLQNKEEKKTKEFSISIPFSFLNDDFIAGFRYINKKKKQDISGFVSSDIYLKSLEI